MENKKGNVKIPLNEYLKLYELQKNLKEDIIRCSEFYYSQLSGDRVELSLTYLTPDETIDKLEKIIQKQNEYIENLNYKIESLERKEINISENHRMEVNSLNEEIKILEDEFNRLTKMNFWKFKQWKKITKKRNKH